MSDLNTREILARNMKLLMQSTNIKQAALAEKTGISQKTISNVLTGSSHSATMDTVEKMAAYFRLKPYHLLIQDLPIEELLTTTIEELINCYANLPVTGKESIKNTINNEIRYCRSDRRHIPDRRNEDRHGIDRRINMRSRHIN